MNIKTKFEVGDKVRVIKTHSLPPSKGDIGIVINNHYPMTIEIGCGHYCLFDNELMLVSKSVDELIKEALSIVNNKRNKENN